MRSVASYLKTSDMRLLSLFNQGLHCRLLDLLMNAITQLGSTGFVIAVPAFLVFSDQVLLAATGVKMAWVLTCGQTVVFIVKRLVHRPRPFKIITNVICSKPTKCPYSLPSGHTCAAFSQALVLAAVFPDLGAIFLILAALVGFSRVYLGVHYPTDVVAGGLIGCAVFLLGSRWVF